MRNDGGHFRRVKQVNEDALTNERRYELLVDGGRRWHRGCRRPSNANQYLSERPQIPDTYRRVHGEPLVAVNSASDVIYR